MSTSLDNPPKNYGITNIGGRSLIQLFNFVEKKAGHRHATKLVSKNGNFRERGKNMESLNSLGKKKPTHNMLVVLRFTTSGFCNSLQAPTFSDCCCLISFAGWSLFMDHFSFISTLDFQLELRSRIICWQRH